MEDVTSWFTQPFCGSAETAVVPFWRLIPRDVRVVVVRRPREEVSTSLRRVMVVVPSNLNSILARLEAKLDQMTKRQPNVVSITYSDLSSPEGAQRVFEHALQTPFDPAWYAALRDVRVVEPFSTFERYGAAYGPQMRRMAAFARGATLAAMRPSRGPSTYDALVFAEESFETFLRDATGLFAEHAAAVGEVPDAWRAKNLTLLWEIEAKGALQIVTARSNGRMFGYLMTELTPSREAPGRAAAIETTFFASPAFPGLGMKLQRENVRRLAARGVSEVWFRDGVRGDGGRLGSMFRRLGAEPAGALWKLDLAPQAHNAGGV